jgi:glycosyltransferase involved in cell wall biosynthesis
VRLVGIGLFDFRANADYQRQIAESLRPAEQEGWVRALQKVSADEVSRAMHASDAAVFPFERGVTSNRSSVLSALAHGLPVVTTNGCDTPAGFADKVPVLLAPPSCPEELADTLGRVLQSPEERAELRRRALRFSAERNWSNAAEETLSFYRQVMRPNGPSDSIATRVGDERHASTGQRT